jgi:ferredoxin-NADP reductase
MLKTIDAFLNRLTMYKIVLYGLLVLLVIADILAWTGVLSIGPVALLVSGVVLGATCYIANELLGRLYHAPRNSESYLITALILTCILPPADSVHRALLVALTGVIAMASKYLLTWRGSHFLNPAATGALVMSVAGLLPATWWVATPAVVIPTSLLALAVLRKQRKFQLFLVFAGSVILLMLYIGVGFHDQSVWNVFKNAWLSWPIIFMGSIMLTEPTTLPPTRYYQLLFGTLVGVVFASQLQVGHVTATPQVALIIGDLMTLVAAPTIGIMLRLKMISALAPDTYDFAFEPVGRRIAFIPGQYLEWTLEHPRADIRGNRRLFSIASSPTEPDLHVGTKTYEPGSTFKRALLGMKVGSYIRAAHPAGSFILPQSNTRPLVFIAGGIGITPFRSMIKQMVDAGQQRNITLLYSARSEADFVYRDVFDAAAANGLQTHYRTDRLDAAALKEALPDLRQSMVYISGPDAMVTGYKQILQGLGVKARNIRTDHFSGY